MRVYVLRFEIYARLVGLTHCAHTIFDFVAFAREAMLRLAVELLDTQSLPTFCAPLASLASVMLSLCPMLNDAGLKVDPRLHLLADVALVPRNPSSLRVGLSARKANQWSLSVIEIPELPRVE